MVRLSRTAFPLGSAAHQEEAGRARVDVETGHAQRVVVVPDRRFALVVRVLEGRATRPHVAPNFEAALLAKNQYQVPSVAALGMAASGRYQASA